MSENNWTSKKALLELLLMLLLILGVFSWYGLAEKPFDLNFSLEQANIKSLFQKDSVPTRNIDSLLIAADKSEDETVDSPVDSTSKYILLCGDSMTEQMRFAWEEYAKKNGHRLMTCTWYSSSTVAWSESNRLSILIKEYKPDIIIFTVGSNELFIPNVEKREKYIKDIILEADTTNIPFVWIGPPNWKDDSGINEIIKKNLGKNRFYYSGHFRKRLARGKDGAHPTREAAAIWTDSIAIWFSTESAYRKKLILNHPKDSNAILPYAPKKEICAPARDQKFKVRILNELHIPLLCKDDPLADEFPLEKTSEKEIIKTKITTETKSEKQIALEKKASDSIPENRNTVEKKPPVILPENKPDSLTN
jgi:hypothetical protein